MTTLVGNFSANGNSDTLKGVKAFTFVIGNDTNENFGGGTVSIQVRQSEKVDWTTIRDVTTSSPNSEKVDTTVEYVDGIQVRLVMSGSTSPNLDYTISYV